MKWFSDKNLLPIAIDPYPQKSPTAVHGGDTKSTLVQTKIPIGYSGEIVSSYFVKSTRYLIDYFLGFHQAAGKI